MHNDSVDKIVTRYFAALTKETFSYKGKTINPKPLIVSPLLFRDYTCPPGCGGCCFKFTLDYLPSEPLPQGVKKRLVELNGKDHEIWTDAQESNEGNRCTHLEPGTGRCGIYLRRPFSCDFELIRTLHSEDDDRADVLTQKLFGRGWSYPRVDGGKGALCEMTPVTPKSKDEVVRKLLRLKEWSDHFGIATWVPDILTCIKMGAIFPIRLDTTKSKGFGL